MLQGNTCVVGLQWGDEGKGKIVDFLAEQADVVVRYCGGANAGHTVRIAGQKYSTHLLPVGIFRPHVMNLIGNGVVLDPEALFNEIDEFMSKGFAISPQNLRISYKTHVVMPYHKAEDAARESSAEGGAIGTTRRGIGPTYADKMYRTTAIRVADLLHEQRLRERIAHVITDRNKVFKVLYDLPPLEWPVVFEQYRDYGRRLAPFVDDTSRILIDAWKAGKRIVFEGAHANLLDVDHGTYPYVTSSNCSALGLFTGAGVPPQMVHNFVGIMKPYCTRVGGGPFPTEQANNIGDYIRERGQEYGTTTRRPRRCGWFDAVATRYSVELNGITHVALTLLDVLGGLDQVQICTAYNIRGQRVEHFRADDTLAEAQPIYETLPGWKADLSGCRRFEDLPPEAQQYVKRLETLVGAPIKLVSVGPEREAMLIR
ncbi:adenylosuccinate synthase [Fontivita pretiosa]|uniref:adenylosuccinate synthase n=1 Tax=Fontivita pretiosa TaxID=2989684 RepID=UPI003D1868AF